MSLDKDIYQKDVSEEFMEEHADKIDWQHISSNQSLSFSFIMKHIKHIPLSSLQRNEKILLTLEQWDAVIASKKS